MSHPNLTLRERRTYHQRLQELNARLSGGVHQLEAEALHPTDAGGEGEALLQEADRPVRTAEENVARTLLASELEVLAETTAALERLANGSFGVCERCGHPIAKARLDTVPYARTCISCARTEADAPRAATGAR